MNSDTQHKLFHFEAEPPAGSWDKIVSSLDEEPVLSFPDRLLSLEAPPPPGAWAAIAASLDDVEEKTPVIPFSRKYRSPLRYASAAAVLLVLVTAATLLWSKKVESGNLATTPSPPPPALSGTPARSSEPPTSESSEPLPGEPENGTVEPEPVSSGVTTASYTRHHTGRIRRVPPATLASFRPRRLMEVNTERRHIPYDGMTERYMVVQDGNTAMRLSKKIYDFFACREPKKECRENMEALQEKMASASLSPSADFTGVLDLIRNLQENQ